MTTPSSYLGLVQKDVALNGVALQYRGTLNIVAVGATTGDSEQDDETTITLPSALPEGGTSGQFLSVDEDGERVWVTVAPGGGGYATIENNTTPVPQRASITLPTNGGLVAADVGGTHTSLSVAGLTNTHIDAAAAIAGSKIAPDFGAQAVVTTGSFRTGTSVATTGHFRLGKTHALAWLDNAGTNNNLLFQEFVSGLGDMLVWRVGPTTHGFVAGVSALSIQNGVQASTVHTVSVTGGSDDGATVFTPVAGTAGVVDIIVVVQWEREGSSTFGQVTLQGTFSFVSGTVTEQVDATELGTGFDTVTGVTADMYVVGGAYVYVLVESATHNITAQVTATITRKQRTL